MLTEVTWAVRTFDTAALEGTPPADYLEKLQKSRTFGGHWECCRVVPKRGLQDITLGAIRRAINDALEPLCLDDCDNVAHHNDQSNQDQRDTLPREVCNPKRVVCNNPIHKTDQNNYDHSKHKSCKPRRNIVLLLPEKEVTLRNLQFLGCDPRKK